MSIDWFGALFFASKGKCLPELIDKNGNRHKFNDIRKCEPLRCLLTESFLKNEHRPFIVYNGTHSIQHLDKLFVSARHKEIIVNEEVAFYFFEPLTHYIIKDGSNPNLEPHILKIDNEKSEINNIRCLELDSLQLWAEKHNIKNLNVYCTDFRSWEHYQSHYNKLKLLSMDLFVAWWSQRTIHPIKKFQNFLNSHDINPKLITKKFWSGAWRYDPSRHFITAFLAGKNLIDNNNVSFYFKVSNPEMTRRFWFGWKEFTFRYPSLSKTILNGNTILQERVPLYFGIEKPTSIDENGSDPAYDAEGYNIRTSHDPIETYYECFCAIVQESRVTQPWPNISEKTLNAIKNYRPFIMCAAPGTLKMLKEMGFKTFDEYWPEDYDEIISNKDRLARVCEIIEYIDSFNIEELKQMYTSMIPILIHNVNNLKNILPFYNELNSNLKKNFPDTTC